MLIRYTTFIGDYVMSNIPFETLIKEKQVPAKERWYPRSVEHYKYAFKIDTTIKNSRALRSNLAYSMQYLEFLEKEFAELTVNSVIYIMIVKSYVITGMSILEGLFSNIIKSNGWWKMSELESLGITKANETIFAGKKIIVQTELLQKVRPYPLQMNLDDLIKILSKHHEALKVDHLVYPALKRLKNLRNRIHIQKAECDTDHDFNAFDFSIKKEMGAILYEILTSHIVTDCPHNFDFLKINTLDEYTHS